MINYPGYIMRTLTVFLQIAPILLTGLLAGLNTYAATPRSVQVNNSQNTHLNVYKSPTCGCCAHWIDHAEENGYSVDSHHPEDLTSFKLTRIGLRYQSCHTAISKEGYRFEGHIPAKYVTQYLNLHRRVPSGWRYRMPVGSPGMEMGDRFMPYQVLLLQEDGSHTVYADVENAKISTNN